MLVDQHKIVAVLEHQEEIEYLAEIEQGGGSISRRSPGGSRCLWIFISRCRMTGNRFIQLLRN